MRRTSAESEDRERYHREVLSYFNKFAPRYDLCAAVISLGTIGRMRKRTVEMLSLKKGALVLDLCTGTGEMPLYLSRAGHRPVGIDFSLPMLRQAVKKKLHARGGLLKGDAARLPFRGGTFDGATISFGLHEMPVDAMDEVIRETARALKPGGKLAVMDWSLPPNPLIRALFNTFINAFENRYCRSFLETDLVCFMHDRGFELENHLRLGLGSAAIHIFQLTNGH